MFKKKYKVISYSGILSTRKKETIGTLKDLAKEFSHLLNGVTPKKPESLIKRLNDSQKGKEKEYTYKTFFIEEVAEMSKWAEIRNDYYDEEEKKVYIDGWKSDCDEEEGLVIAKVNYETKEVEYIDKAAKTDVYAQEIINETLKNIDNGDFRNC